jgi:hypothetical protein
VLLLLLLLAAGSLCFEEDLGAEADCCLGADELPADVLLFCPDDEDLAVLSLVWAGADDLASVLRAGADEGLAVTLLFSGEAGLAVEPVDLVETLLFSEVEGLADTLLSELTGLSAALLLAEVVCETLLLGVAVLSEAFLVVAVLSEAFLVVAGVEVRAPLLLDTVVLSALRVVPAASLLRLVPSVTEVRLLLPFERVEFLDDWVLAYSTSPSLLVSGLE